MHRTIVFKGHGREPKTTTNFSSIKAYPQLIFVEQVLFKLTYFYEIAAQLQYLCWI